MLLLLLCIIASIPCLLAQTCAGNTCADCTKSAGCGWCAPLFSCVEGNATGPSTGVCHGRAWFFTGTDNECPDCSALEGCTACTDDIACGWLENSGTCVDAATAGASQICPCSEREQCTDCLRGGRCTFCSNTGLCQDGTGGGCTPLASCNCSLMPSCAICVEQDDICGWCGATGSCQNLGSGCASGEGDTCDGPTEQFDDRNQMIVALSVGWFVVVVLAVVIIVLLVVKPGIAKA